MNFSRLTSSLAISALVATAALAQDSYHKPTAGPGPDGKPQTTFIAHHLGTDHAEGISSIDMNGDGHPDLLSGAYWYENPGPNGGEWKRHQYRTVGIHNEFVSDCGEWAIDVNHDGLPDVVTTGWITNGIFWYQNPGKSSTGMWEKHKIADSFDTEGGAFADINGDGKPDLALAHYNHNGILWVDFSGAQPKVHKVGDYHQDGHGVGITDVDGDGKADIMTPYGWFKNIDANNDKWEWKGEWMIGDTGFPILGYDVNGDGKQDIIFGQGHGYGLYWIEQAPGGKWIKHTIDESFSQSHALLLNDLDHDGVPELVTGKRYRGHSGNDPGSYDPLVIYYYSLDRKAAKFTRHAISVNGTAGAGTQFIAADFDGDGDLDLASAGKTGVTFYENLTVNKVPKATRESQIILNKDWPFPGEGAEVPQEDGPKFPEVKR